MRNVVMVLLAVAALASSAEVYRLKQVVPAEFASERNFMERSISEAKAREVQFNSDADKLKERILRLQRVLDERGLTSEIPSPDDKISDVWPKLIYNPADGPDSVGGADGDWPIP
jgi:hypothetical protein